MVGSEFGAGVPDGEPPPELAWKRIYCTST